MNKPSLEEFEIQPVAEKKPRTPRPTKDGEEVKGITLRLKESEWEHLSSMALSERLKIQPYVLALIRADFEKRGLRF